MFSLLRGVSLVSLVASSLSALLHCRHAHLHVYVRGQRSAAAVALPGQKRNTANRAELVMHATVEARTSAAEAVPLAIRLKVATYAMNTTLYGRAGTTGPRLGHTTNVTASASKEQLLLMRKRHRSATKNAAKAGTTGGASPNKIAKKTK